MRWVNKGHELDKEGEKFVEKVNKGYQFYIFGAGVRGKELYITILQRYNCFGGFIDNSKIKQGNGYLGERVYSLEQYLEMKNRGWIVIAVAETNIAIIISQLKRQGLLEEENFFLYEKFENEIFPLVATYCFDKIFVPITQISLTERCTLKCKKCAHGCYMVDSKTKDLSLKQVLNSADYFFKKVDHVKEFVLIGGEPLLYKELVQAITYIGEKYRNKIGIFSITTNGTIIPNEGVLNASRKNNVLFRISNYSKQLPKLKIKIAELMDILQKNEVSFILRSEDDEWMDYGFDNLKTNRDEKELTKVFDMCKTPCREVRENRFYYCVMARSVSDNLGYHIGEKDYLDLDRLEGKEYKKIFLEFMLGYSEKGYLEMCSYCNGAEAKKHSIPAAEQMSK